MKLFGLEMDRGDDTGWILRESRKTPILLALFVALAVALSGCGDEGAGSANKIDANGCKQAAKPVAKTVDVQLPTEALDPEQTNTATIVTNCGKFVIELAAKKNPRTASSFAHLVEEGVYDGTWFHRIVPGFVIQGGDPNADGTGGSGYDIVEPPTGKYRVGTVAMAKAANDPAGSSSSQFYIVLGEAGTALPPDYAIAGRVVEGQDVVEKIARYAPPDGSSESPTGVAIIESAKVTSTN